MFIKNLQADMLKVKGTSILLAHIVIPVIISVLFLSYYSFSAWDESTKIIAFYQAIGAGFPVLIGIFTAGIIEQEQNAGEFQNILTMRKKTNVFLSKILLLLILSMFSLTLATVIFWVGFTNAAVADITDIKIYITASLIVWCSSIPLYIWQMIIAFRFGKGVSIGAGIGSGLVCLLLLTNMGDFIWKYFPCTWTGRVPDAYLNYVFGEKREVNLNNLKIVVPIICIFTVISLIYYLFKMAHWEGCRISE